MAIRYKTGTYLPTAGKCHKTKVVKYRSSYELRFCVLLDNADIVDAWEYEQMWIAYDYRGVRRNYLVDFVIRLTNGRTMLVEIKPYAFYVKAMYTKDQNWHKWNAAISLCRSKGWDFKVVTEQTIPALASAWNINS